MFSALVDIDYDRDIVFESFSSSIVDEGLSLACGIWRDTWTDNDPLAAHAKTFIEMKWEEAQRRRGTNATGLTVDRSQNATGFLDRGRSCGDFATLSSSPRRVRQANVVAALQAIFAQGRLSRAELARQLGLNRSSSGNIIAELTTSCLVREVAEETPKAIRAGRPGILLELVPEAACFVGAEIGVEHITALRIGLAADVIDFRVVPFDGRSAPVTEAVDRAVDIAFGGLSAEELERCEGFGLSAPAQMDRQGRVRIAPLLGWQNVDLAALTRAALPRRYAVDG